MTHHPFDHDHAAMWGVDPLSAEALRAFKRSMMLHRRLLTSVLAGEDMMHPAQAGCLQVLSSRDGMSQSDLADALHVSRPTVTTMLQRMQAAGLVDRRDDAADSRVTRVYLTAEGRTVAEHMRAAFAEMIDLSIGRLTEADRRDLTRILTTLNAQVESVLEERGVSAWVHPHGHGSEGLR